MAGIRRRLGSLLGPEGRAPQIAQTVTRQVSAGAPARAEFIKIGGAHYRVEVDIPRGLDGDPTAATDFGAAIAAEINTEGSLARSAASGAAIHSVGAQLIFSTNINTPLSPGQVLMHIASPHARFMPRFESLSSWDVLGASQDHWTVESGNIQHRDPRFPGSFTPRGILMLNQGSYTNISDCEIVSEISFTEVSTTTMAGVMLRGSGSSGADVTAYVAYFRNSIEDANQSNPGTLSLHIARIVSGSFQQIGEYVIPGTPDYSKARHIRLRAHGETLSAKTWSADTQEPSGWQIVVEDSAIRIGRVGFYSGSLLRRSSYHNLGIATGGLSAPLEEQ